MKKTLLHLKMALLGGLMLTQLASNVFGQQDPQYTMYMFNPLSINPAFAGSRDALSVTLLGRKQWVNFEGAPETGSFSIHTPLKRENIALGLSVIYDKIGPTTTTVINADIAYRFQVTNKSKLSFGIKGGVDFTSANFSKLAVIDPSDPLYTTPISSTPLPHFGAGLYWYSPEYYVGLTVPNILQNEYDAGLSGSTAKQNRHYFFTAGYTFKLTSTIEMIPSVITKVVMDAPVSVDANLNFFFYEKLWLGGGYRFGDGAVANIMYQFSPLFRAGYAYDYTLSDLGSYNSGSHEIMLNYDLDFLGKGFKTPRRF